MDEKQYIYARLQFLSDELRNLTDVVEKQSDLIGKLSEILSEMQTPEYTRKQAKAAEMAEVAEKLAYFRRMNRR